MSEDKIVISLNEMKGFVRYEDSYRKYEVDGKPADVNRFVYPESYQMTLEDLLEALKNLKEDDPTIFEYGEFWFNPIFQARDAYGISDQNTVKRAKAAKQVRWLSCLPEEIMDEVWDDLEWLWDEYNGDSHLKDTLYLDDLIEQVERAIRNRGKDIRDMEFTDEEKEFYISMFEPDEHLDEATELEKDICREFVEELCEKDRVKALRLKGYACYGGNALYACDWKTSRDIMIRLYELTQDARYANTLGYIYYYGRCTEGKPEYEKAFANFQIAAACGLYEGIYKLADMYRHGYGCVKNEHAAYTLYRMVYDECYQRLLDGEETTFADASLRFGAVLESGVWVEQNLGEAYRYYTQAEYFAKKRAQEDDFFGNTTVVINIVKSKERLRQKLGESFFADALEDTDPYLVERLLEDNNRLDLTVHQSEDNRLFLRAVRVPVHKGREIKPILVSSARLDYCQLTIEAEYELLDASVAMAEETVRIDAMEWSPENNQYELWFNDQMVGWIKCSRFLLRAPEKKKPSGRLLHFASIAFQEGGRTYDYLLEDQDVEIGDHVIVEGYEGETEVTVMDVSMKYESELGIPLSRYKKILRKA